jgi:HAE1 family hydrophobic/amphiphilic exporter-1
VTLSDLSIRRPVFTWMMVLALATFGVMGLRDLGVDRFPKMEMPFVGVHLEMPGASPGAMEEDVVDVLEEQFATLEGLRHMKSESSHGVAQIVMEFELEVDVDVAAQDVRDKLNFALQELPKDLEPPSIGKYDPSIFPIVWAPISSSLPPTETTEYVERHIKPFAERIPGVAGVSIYGARERNIRIWIDAEALRARNLATSDLLAALRREHVDRPGGFVEGDRLEWSVKTDAEFASVEELRTMVVAWDGDAPIRLGEVARVEDGMEDVRDASRMNGEPGLAIALSKQSDANTVAIVDEFYRRMGQLRGYLPEGLRLADDEGFLDFSESIREAFEETIFALVFGGVLAVLVVFVFLRRWRPTLIVATAIPLSLITTFGVMWALGYTLNIMTLLGMTLAIGVVIDDAIIVLENIERHREEGKPAFEAAEVGTRQITFAATAATFSVAAVFLPVAFSTGRMGSFLTEFGVTVASAVIVSLFVALTLTPMLAARIPPQKEMRERSIQKRLERWLNGLEERYRLLLRWSLGHRLQTAGIAVASVVIGWAAFQGLDGEFFPASDTGMVILEFRTPPGSSLESTLDVLYKNERYLMAREETASVFARIGQTTMDIGGPNWGMITLQLKPQEERERSATELMSEIRRDLARIPGQEIKMMNPGSMGGSDFEILLVGNTSLVDLDDYSDRLIQRLKQSGGFVDLDKSLRLGLPEVRVVPDRDKAASLGVDAATLAEVVQVMIGGLDVATFKAESERHDIRMRLERGERDTIDAIGDLWVRARSGELIELRNLVRLETGTAASAITRSDRMRSVSITANLEGIKLGEAVRTAFAIGAEILPEGLSLETAGDAESMQEMIDQFTVMLILAVLVIYMVLAAQFESFMHPLTVMLALPFSLTGALGALWLTGMTLNMFSLIGLVLLIGLVTKNSILLVDYANQLRAEGMDKLEAIRTAAPVRMRPVLMTALSMIFGVLPAALGIGPGAESRAPMAVATAAGMFSSMLLTLLIVPVFYVALDDFGEWVRALPRRLRNRTPRTA